MGWSAQDRGDWKLAAFTVLIFVVGGLLLLPFVELPLNWLDRSYDTGGARVHELWALHRGQQVLLLRTTDGLRFGQVHRAVRRAVEQQRGRQ